MGASRRILKAECVDAVSELTQRRRRGAARESGAHHDDLIFPLVRGIDQLHLEAVLLPLLVDRTGRHAPVERGVGDLIEGGVLAGGCEIGFHGHGHYLTTPLSADSSLS